MLKTVEIGKGSEIAPYLAGPGPSSSAEEAADAGKYPYLVASLHCVAAFSAANLLFPTVGQSLERTAVLSLLFLGVMFALIQLFSAPVASAARRFPMVAILFLVWCLITVARGITTQAPTLVTLLTNPSVGGLVWLVPFVAMLAKGHDAIRAVYRPLRLQALISVPFSVSVIAYVLATGARLDWPDTWAQVGPTLAYGVPFILLTRADRLGPRWLLFAILILTGVADFCAGNRAFAALDAAYLVCVIGYGREALLSRALPRIAVLTAGGVLVGFFVLSSLRGVATSGLLADTRTFLFRELAADFTNYDWVFGRGALGAYYSPYFEHWRLLGLPGDSPYRQTSEVGYLFIVLKMGLVGVALYLATMLSAVFSSRYLADRRLAGGCMLYLMLHTVSWGIIAGAGVETRSVLDWLVVGACFSGAVVPVGRRTV